MASGLSRNFKRNPQFEEDVKKQQAFTDHLHGVAKLVEPHSKRIMAGVGRGRVADDIRAEEDRIVLAHKGYFSAGIEFGSKNNPTYAPLRRGVIAAGLRHTYNPKQ